MWVDNRFNFLSSLIHHVIGGSEVALLKGVLCCTMPEEQVLRLSALVELDVLLVVFILTLSIVLEVSISTVLKLKPVSLV